MLPGTWKTEENRHEPHAARLAYIEATETILAAGKTMGVLGIQGQYDQKQL